MLSFYPYSLKLKQLLSEHYKDKAESIEVCSCQGHSGVQVLDFSLSHLLQVDTMGLSGERVITAMGERLDRTLKETTKTYDWILLLGGTYT